MKNLISVDAVKQAAAKGQHEFCVDNNTLITPAARDFAREKGITFVTADTAQGQSGLATGKPASGKTIDKELLYQIVKQVLCAKGMLASSVAAPPYQADVDPQSGLKVVQGNTVTFEEFDTGKAGTKVAYREVISKTESRMSSGFLTIDQSSFEWELTGYEEIDFVVAGSLQLTINGITRRAVQGDVIFIPKGSRVTWQAEGFVKLFYTTYPADWADQMA